MGWKQCIARGDELSSIQLAVADLHLALAAANHDAPEEYALFHRSQDDTGLLLLSPAAGEYAHVLPGFWTDASDFLQHRWTLIYGLERSHERLGLKPPNDHRVH